MFGGLLGIRSGLSGKIRGEVNNRYMLGPMSAQEQAWLNSPTRLLNDPARNIPSPDRGWIDHSPSTSTPKGHRTPEQITAQLEARYRELGEQAKRHAERAKLQGCESCRWFRLNTREWVSDNNRRIYARCVEPLMKGFDEEPHKSLEFRQLDLSLCGPEKALWQPKLSWWQKIWDWFVEHWR